MKKIVVATLAGSLAVLAHAQGYVGAVASLTSAGIDCSGMLECDHRSVGLKVYGGSYFEKQNQINLGIASVNALEVGVVNFGKSEYAYNRGYTAYDVGAGGVSADPVVRKVTKTFSANALFAAVVAEMPLADALKVRAKAGVAYVSATYQTSISGYSDGSETESKFKPYVGLGMELEAVKGVRLVGAFDWTKYSISDQKGSLKSLGVGAELSF